ncbi:MAG: response regulator [Myxococcales bacterium]|nr:response regulator [Myxococcales bacterium]
MSNRILIVESDASLSRNARGQLEGAGFTVEETSDGKGSLELVRKQRPDLVVLAVDLPAGQNGYIICGKLKKDDELKATLVIIVGDPKGFDQHRKLKTRADDYLPKPLDLQRLVEAAGGLIGFPDPPEGEVVDESLSLSDLVEDEEPSTGEFQPEEIAVVPETVHGDPELDMLDAAFDDISGGRPAPAEQEAEEIPVKLEEEEVSALNNIAEESAPGEAFDDDQKTQIFLPDEGSEAPARPPASPPPPPPAPARAQVAPMPFSRSAGPADGELRELRAKVTQLTGSLEDANTRLSEQEARIRGLEDELSSKTAELEATRSGGGKHDKEFFALKDQGTKKDKEILRLKSELNEKEKELVERQERENQLEQQLSEAQGEQARKDAQLRAQSSKVDQLSAERKRMDSQLSSAKEEARSAGAQLSELEGDLQSAQDRLRSVESELDQLREARDSAESQIRQAREEAEELQRKLNSSAGETDSAQREAEELRSQLESVQSDLDATKGQLTSQATAFAEEMAGLRKRIGEMEEASAKYEERVGKLYGRVKDGEKLREKTKKALSIALQLLDEQTGGNLDLDEEAAA